MSISTPDAPTRDTLVVPHTGLRKLLKLEDLNVTGTGGAEGSFRAVFSLFNTVDLDRDVTLPGAFQVGAKTRISAWGHNWGALPVGRGAIGADDQKAWVDGQFNLKTAMGRDTYETVKDLGELQQWSYGYDILESSYGTFGDPPEEVQYLKKLGVNECSPVMLGAQPSTFTETIKATGLGTGLPFAEHVELVTAAVAALVERTEDRVSQRAKEGRVLSAATITRLGEHPDTLRTIAKAIDDLLTEAAPKPKADQAEALKAHAQAVMAEVAMYLDIAHIR